MQSTLDTLYGIHIHAVFIGKAMPVNTAYINQHCALRPIQTSSKNPCPLDVTAPTLFPVYQTHPLYTPYFSTDRFPCHPTLSAQPSYLADLLELAMRIMLWVYRNSTRQLVLNYYCMVDTENRAPMDIYLHLSIHAHITDISST